MNRRKVSIQNTAIALISEIMVTVVGFLLPRSIMITYGSETNGLITSLQQFIQYFTLLEAGLSGAAIFALYKPLSNGDVNTIERILYSAKQMYGKLGKAFIILVMISSLLYPYFIAETGYSHLTVTVLFCMIGLNGAMQLLFIGKYKVLLNASQNSRYIAVINSLSTCLYSINIIIASSLHWNIVAATGFGTLAYVIRAIAYYTVVRRLFPHYDFHKCENQYHFENQTEVFIQQILSLLILNSSTLILAFTKTRMNEISVFTTYNMVLTAIFLVTNAVNTGVSASFGDLIARHDENKLTQVYKEYEVLFQAFWVIVFSCVLVLYQPFMRLYTEGIEDAAYIRPELCFLCSILGALWVIRNQQSVIIVAAGKFKEIQRGSIVEAILTITLSFVGLVFWGLEGLIAGRCIAAGYRVVDFIQFSSCNVVMINTRYTIQQICISTVFVMLVYFAAHKIQMFFLVDTYVKWGMFAFVTAILAAFLAIGFILINKGNISWIQKKLEKDRK